MKMAKIDPDSSTMQLLMAPEIAQVLEKLAANANWELPQDLLRRQARNTLQRRVMEMKNAGMSDQQIKGRRRLLEQDVLKSTAAALKEHFVLQGRPADHYLYGLLRR